MVKIGDKRHMINNNNEELVTTGRREAQLFSPVSKNSPVVHTRAVVTSIIEKALVNLDVLSQVEVGDKLGWTASGHFVIQKPTYFTVAMRFINRCDRWNTLIQSMDCAGSTALPPWNDRQQPAPSPNDSLRRALGV